MRTKVKQPAAATALTRVLAGLGQELLDAPDEEILQAAKDLGMDPAMPGSAAFAGLKYPVKPQLTDFFDLDACRQLLDARPSSPEPKRKVRGSRRSALPRPGKRPNER